MQVGNAAISVGAGTQRLTLPDIEFGLLVDLGTRTKVGRVENEDIDGEWGWSLDGEIEVPLDGLVGHGYSGAVKGFFGRVEDKDSVICGADAVDTGTVCGFMNIVDFPNLAQEFGVFQGAGEAEIETQRDVDHWGVALELKRELASGAMSGPGQYLALGADFRAIEQDISLRGTGGESGPLLTPVFLEYDEELDTRYYGAYAAYGREFCILCGINSALGIVSTIRGQVGLYYADTDYDGRYTFVDFGVGVANTDAGLPTKLSLSSDDVAVIAGVELESSLPIGRRMRLSLKSNYDWYSRVADMEYNDTDVRTGAAAEDFNTLPPGDNAGTRIGDDDAFSARTSLNLKVLLGPDDVMPVALK